MYNTRQDALKNGEKQYFDGKPCKHGHIAPKHVAGGCMECRKENGKKYRENNSEHIKMWHRENHAKNYSSELRKEQYRKNIISEMFNAAKLRAKNKNLSFTIAKEDVIIPEKCPVFGIPLDHRDRLHAPTLDRIDNKKGYDKDNIKVISAKANRLKNNGTISDFELILEYMKSGNK